MEKKTRVLCLHGYGQNGGEFREKTLKYLMTNELLSKHNIDLGTNSREVGFKSFIII
jgi:hypothetical protein